VSNKILMLDIETLPGTAYVFSLWDHHIPLERLKTPPRVVCWSAKWLGKKEMYFSAEWLHGRASMLERIHVLLDEADAVVTYNGDKFDLPKLMGEFAGARLRSPGPLTSIDLYKTARKLGYISNKLEFVTKHFGIGEKIKHEGFRLWKRVDQGDPIARRKMEVYNKQDVRLLDRLYKYLRPYIKNHPYLGQAKARCCPTCGSKKVQKRGTRRTKSFFIERLHCQACGAWGDGVRTKVTQ